MVVAMFCLSSGLWKGVTWPLKKRPTIAQNTLLKYTKKVRHRNTRHSRLILFTSPSDMTTWERLSHYWQHIKSNTHSQVNCHWNHKNTKYRLINYLLSHSGSSENSSCYKLMGCILSRRRLIIETQFPEQAETLKLGNVWQMLLIRSLPIIINFVDDRKYEQKMAQI